MGEGDLKALRGLTRKRLALMWEQAKLTDQVQALAEYADQAEAIAQLLDGDDAETANLIKALREHPEYYEVWDRLEEYGDDDIEVDGSSPIMHIHIHGIVENQLAAGDPPFVIRALRKLVNNGVSRHQAVHVIGTALAEQIWTMLAEKREYDREKYGQDVSKYVSERLAWEAELDARKKTHRKKARRRKR